MKKFLLSTNTVSNNDEMLEEHTITPLFSADDRNLLVNALAHEIAGESMGGSKIVEKSGVIGSPDFEEEMPFFADETPSKDIEDFVKEHFTDETASTIIVQFTWSKHCGSLDYKDIYTIGRIDNVPELD